MKRSGTFLMLFLSVATSLVYASGDGCNVWCGEYPNAYFIAPGNDSRGNLGLILEDQGIVHYTPQAIPFHYAEFAGPKSVGEPVEPVTQNRNELGVWTADLGIAGNMVQETATRLAVEHYGRCLTDNTQAITSLFKALQNSNLPAQDKTQLASERLRFAGLCEKSLEAYQPLQVSAAAKPYARYLEAAAVFYAGQYDRAAALFQMLTAETKKDWVQETSLYMLGRVALNQAQTRYDSFGELNAATIDRAMLAKATAAFDAYLKAFPQGRYTESAKGLFRKIHWLAADGAALVADYQTWQAKIKPGATSQAVLDFINETEIKANPIGTKIDELWAAPLLAMQNIVASWRTTGDGSPQTSSPVSIEVINAHHRQFSDAQLETLWSYLVLAHSYWVAKDYASVIQQTATDAIRGQPSNVVYSRWVLRGLALMALQRWAEAEAYWQTLLKTVEHPGHKLQAKWLLALTWNAQDRLDGVYARNSMVANNDIQEFFIHIAKPILLKSLLTWEDLPPHTRSLAYFTLVNQWVRHRDFKTAAAILSTYPASGYPLAQNKSAPLTWTGQADEYACPALNELLTVIQQTPKAARWLNCMGDFLRTQDWDYPTDIIVDEESYDQNRHRWHILADYGLPLQKPVDVFGEKVYTSLDYYMDVITLRSKVAFEDMAYALHRATRCFASSGNNHCGNQEIAKEQRFAWFKRLKSEFKNSRWEKEQKYYW
ncbi:conserved exported hypothetical protein [Gammaproteobacteria bacterium]